MQDENNDVAVVMFFGHGTSYKKDERLIDALVPYDSFPTFANCNISADEIKQILAKANSNSITMILDSSFTFDVTCIGVTVRQFFFTKTFGVCYLIFAEHMRNCK